MIKVGIVGGTGYTGVELLRLLAAHPRGRACARSRRARKPARGSPTCSRACAAATTSRSPSPRRAGLDQCDVVFFATPHGVAMAQARELLDAGVRIIDLAADFRLARPARCSSSWYKMPHACPDLLAEAVYGLPEINRERDPQGAHRRQSRLLSDRGAARLPAAGRSRPRRHRPPDRRLQVGRVGAGRKAEVGPAVRRGVRQFQGLRRRRATAIIRRSSRGCNAREPDAGQARLHAAPDADDPRHPRDAVCAADATVDVDLQALFEKRYARRAVRRRACRRARCPTRAACAASNMLPHRRAPPARRRHGRRPRGRGQPRQGRGGPGGAEHEPHVRASRDDGAHARCRCCLKRRASSAGIALVAPAAPELRHQRAAHGGAHARCRGGGAALILLALVAIVAGMWWWGFDFGQLFGGFNRKEVEARLATLEADTARCAAEATELRARNVRSSRAELAMTERRAGGAAAPGDRAGRRERAAQGGARLPAEALRRREQGRAAVTIQPPDGRARGRRRVALQPARRPRRQPRATISRATSSLQATVAPADRDQRRPHDHPARRPARDGGRR